MTATQELALYNAEALLRFGASMDFERAAVVLRDLKRLGLGDHAHAEALRSTIQQHFGDIWGDTILFRLGGL